jgi:hypothetical protein
MRRLIPVLVLALAATFLVACDDDTSTAQVQERAVQQNNYERLVANQPAQEASYSLTRDTINFWVNTWGHEPGKLSFVYLMAANGQLIGYYVLEGLPVSYCVSLSPNYRWERPGGSTSYAWEQVPAPALDGVYYSGGACNVYYGRDATTGSYVEFSTGDGINFLLYEEPLPRQDVEPLGMTTINDVGDAQNIDELD